MIAIGADHGGYRLKEEIKRVTREAYEGFQGQKENEKFYPLKEALEGLDGHLQKN